MTRSPSALDLLREEQREWVFVFQETMSAGNRSDFFFLDNPEREDG